nr:immunoglobulin light chain junction region [Macaca mulatta]
CVQAMEFPFTF